MESQMQESIRRLLIRLEDARREVQQMTYKAEYPLTSKLERVYDCLETAEKHLQDIMDE